MVLRKILTLISSSKYNPSFSLWIVSRTVRGIVHLKKSQMKASLSIIFLLIDLQLATIITIPNRHQFLHYLNSSAAPTDWVFDFRSPCWYSLLLLSTSILSLIIFNHLHNNNCNLYDFYHLLSRLLLFPTLYSVNGNYLLLVLCHLC